MDGLQFLTATPPVRSDPARADIACFLGFVPRRETAARQRDRLEQALRRLGWSGPALPSGARVLPDEVLPAGDSSRAFAGWLRALGWTPRAGGAVAAELFGRAAAELHGRALVGWWTDYGWLSTAAGRSAADLLELHDVPVPIDAWDLFDALFAWEARPLLPGSDRRGDTMLGAAVRRFFLQGGRKCYVVRLGDPWHPFTERSARGALLPHLLNADRLPTPVARETWRGVGHVLGLPDVSFLSVPDLPDLCALPAGSAMVESEPAYEERFVECAARVSPPAFRSLRAFPAPRSDDRGFAQWSAFVRRVGDLLRRASREVQFVAAVPLSADDTLWRTQPEFAGMAADARRRATARRAFAARQAQQQAVAAIDTAFVQLVYPWLHTRESVRLPGALEAPDAMLVGVLANLALTEGAWRSAERERLAAVLDVEPTLSRTELDAQRTHVSLIGPSAVGVLLLSDVTADDDEAYRPASVNRLVSAVVRAARLVGEDVVFASSGEAVWRRVRAGLEQLLLRLWGDGALAGTTATSAFSVRCDRSTMTQADLDAGRVVARIEFTAAHPISHVTVVLAMDEGGQVTLVAPTGAQA